MATRTPTNNEKPLNVRVHELREEIAAVRLDEELPVHPQVLLLGWVRELAEIVYRLEARP